MFTFIGKRPWMQPVPSTIGDSYLAHPRYGADTIGGALLYAPDGLIVRDDTGQCYETRDRDIIPIDPYNPGTMTTAKQNPPVTVTRKDVALWRKEAQEMHRDFMSRYGRVKA